MHSLLPKERVITRRGGKGNEFYTPGDDQGGRWGSGQNWPLEPAEGGPLPEDPKLRHAWKLFWGEDFNKILSSNRKNVVPGSWRVEVSPALPAETDFFLHVLEIGSSGSTGRRRTELLDGVNVQGAALEHGPMVLFSTTGSVVNSGEVSLPDLACESLIPHQSAAECGLRTQPRRPECVIFTECGAAGCRSSHRSNSRQFEGDFARRSPRSREPAAAVRKSVNRHGVRRPHVRLMRS